MQRWDIASGQAAATFTMPLSDDEDTSVQAHLAVICETSDAIYEALTKIENA